MMAPWIWTIIFLSVGLAFAVLELFLPSGGLLAFFSFASFCACIVFAFHQGIEFGIAFTVALLAGLPIMIWQMLAIWPYTPIGKRMLLDPENDPALGPDPEKDLIETLLGKTGVAKSRMMPSGTVLIENKRFDAVSEGEPIDPGTPIIVVKANKLNIIVRPQLQQEEGKTVQIPRNSGEPTVVDPFG